MSLNRENDASQISAPPCPVCRNCENVGVKFRDASSLDVECDFQSNESKCRSWLSKCTISSDGESVYSSETSGTADTNFSESTQEDESDSFENENVVYEDKVVCVNETGNDNAVEKLLISPSNQYGDVRMRRCKNVHLGNITKIYGPVHVTQTTSTVSAQSVTNQIFLQGAAVPVASGRLSIIHRRSWLAQPPVEEKKFLAAPAKFVIISHTATEDGFTQAENVYLVRIVQTFHIESKKWSDIAYNFLIGSDGNVYEGRGWGVVGAHTLGYNIVGMGISFVGCFMNKLPPQSAIHQAKSLIKHGVEIGAIDKDYQLVGHCQCSPTESPGRRLYEEIQTWEHWHNLSGKENVSPATSTAPS